MNEKTSAILVTIAFSLVGIIGDYFLELASSQEKPLWSRSFFIGFALYASTAFGWVFVMRHLILGTIGVLYSLSMIVLLTAVGVLFFEEKLNQFEILGMILAFASMFLLVRFS